MLCFLPQVGEILKEKFDSAHEVQQKKRRGRRMLLPRFQRFKPHTDTDLVYLRDSPDYCEFDIQKGSLGTHGRECNPVSNFAPFDNNKALILCICKPCIMLAVKLEGASG